MPLEMTQQLQSVQLLRQEQTMTHQQIQALELLFAPALALHPIVNEAMEKNPVLEGEPDEADQPSVVEGDDWLEKIIKLEEENRYIRSNYSHVSADEEERRRHYLESVSVEKSLQETLLEQLRFLDLEIGLQACCEVAISSLNDDGYLTSHPADLAMAAGQALPMVEQATRIVQDLEPAGVAARDLRERLLIQLDRKGRRESVTYSAVRDHLRDIGDNHLPLVARRMGIPIDQLKEVVTEIQNLNPRLKAGEVRPNEYISEEVQVIETDGKMSVQMNNDHLPNLFISKQYRNLISDPDTPREVRDYIKEKIRSGVFLINSIIQRQTTIRKIVNSIVSMQEDFFRFGMEHLKPLTMAKVAKDVGVHETTVSRAVAGKYLRCKYGLLSLRQFFSTGYEIEDGRSVSNAVVKGTIRQLIDSEDGCKPLSDSQITKELSALGYKVVRRTVAKYRESMGILASNLRRQY